MRNKHEMYLIGSSSSLVCNWIARLPFNFKIPGKHLTLYLCKKTLKKLSILGLVLMAASAVTAAILPDSKEDEQQLYTLSFGGSATANSDTTKSCAPTDQIADDDPACNGPDNSVGSGGSGSSSHDPILDNTSGGTTAA